MADETKALDRSLPELLKRFQQITDPQERAKFYRDNPRLKDVYSPVNFPPAPSKD